MTRVGLDYINHEGPEILKHLIRLTSRFCLQIFHWNPFRKQMPKKVSNKRQAEAEEVQNVITVAFLPLVPTMHRGY